MSAREELNVHDELRRPELVREANDRIADAAVRLHFVSRVPMQCECSTLACREVFLISLEEYRAARAEQGAYLTAPAHHLDGARLLDEHAEYWLQRRR